MTPHRRHLAVVLVAVAATVLGLLPAGPARATHTGWAPASSATIRPGVQTFTGGTNQCTSAFVFTSDTEVYLGQSAHCAATGAANETDGCLARSMPLGTPVEVQGATRPGTLVYSSWLTMQGRREASPDACRYNDFALVRLDPADHGRVNPSVPFFGGPTAVAPGVTAGSTVHSYGSSSLRLGLTALSPKDGVALTTKGGGWNHVVYTATPGIPGDSGSGFLDSSGRAFGVLSTLNVLPEPGGNGVADLARALAYLHAHAVGFADVRLVPGTEPFTGGRLLR